MHDRHRTDLANRALASIGRKGGLVLWTAVLVLAGCQQTYRQGVEPSGLEAQSSRMNVYELARQVGMSVAEVDNAFVKLKNNSNTVVIFTHSDAQLFVNGEQAGPVGPIERIGKTIYVDPGLADQIKKCLVTEQAPSRVLTGTKKPAMGCIVVDPGHGGKDPGAISPLGFQEKAVNLVVAQQLASLLRQSGFRVVMTRDRDVFLELEERAALTNREDADLFVSVHADSSHSRDLNGFTVYTARGASSRARWAADAIVSAMRPTGLQNNGVREADYRVLVQTRCPAVLVELGYISNTGEAGKLRDPYTQRRLAQAIADGVLRSMGN
ncbi:MAG: N-acetylmuramoyl-L-alanine amidase [Phycisphaerae bacterium]|nr:N-acetylmuramoyl-L-alanine amidase [Phycisphaerae bacterium]